jgi:sugar/nucleoside kinase (ribokinase family)
MTHVVCVGDLMVDVLARLPGPLAAGSDTPAPIEFHGGGAAANVAAWLAASGAGATFVGRVGADMFGEQAVAELTALGVTTAVTVDPDRPTGTCIVLVAPDGERTMVPSAGANAVPGDVHVLPARADWLYLSGYPLLREETREYGLTVLEHARAHRWRIAVDIASAAPLLARQPRALFDDLGADLLLFANTDEATVVTGVVEPSAAARALAQQCGHAVVKCGSAGAVWSDGTDTRSIPATAGELVDSTGAGDAFAAGFLSVFDGKVNGPGAPAAALFAATKLAAVAIGVTGARPHDGHVA